MDLKGLAQRLKLTVTSVAEPIIQYEELDFLKKWLGLGYHGQMNWLARDIARRCDPRLSMPECKGVIVCAMKYDEMPARQGSCRSGLFCAPRATRRGARKPFAPPLSDAPFTAPKYLQHEDYHKAMMRKLKAIAETIKQEYPEAHCKCYVDTGPVLEKAWAVRAGLGFIGKNTLLISPEHGSQMALGIILSSVVSCQSSAEQPSSAKRLTTDDRRLTASCGSCRNCIDACPTGALVAPYTLDARKCISYKFFVGKEEGGCDICQDVCPFNKGMRRFYD